MGLFKWFKRDLSSSSPRPPYNKSITLDSNIKLSRSESYVKALNKFYKWRQKRILLANRELMGCYDDDAEASPTPIRLAAAERNTSGSSNSNNSSVSRFIYEEIDVEHNKQAALQYDCVQTSPASDGQPSDELASDYENTSYKYNYVRKEYRRRLKISDMRDEDQLPEYAMPFQVGPDEAAAHFERPSASDTESEKYYSVYHDESRKNLLITDLDNSQGTVTTAKEGDLEGCSGEFLFLEALKNFTDLMVCSKEHIKPLARQVAGIHFHPGQISAFEISYVPVEMQQDEALHNNMEALRQLRHPHVLLLMGITIDAGSKLDSIIYEPVQSSLHERIHQEKTQLPVACCLKFTQQLIAAVSYLHRMEFIHTNVCSHNLLLAPNMEAVKLAGFEVCCKTYYLNEEPGEISKIASFHVDHRKLYTRHNYQAPELLSNLREYVQPTVQSDIYGICITLWEMLNCAEPYHQFDYRELVKVFSLKTAYLPSYQEQRQQPFNEVLEKGLALKWENRIKDTEALAEQMRDIQVVAKSKPDSLIAQKNNTCPEEVFYERTSTTKRKKGAAKMSNLKAAKVEGHPQGEECLSPGNKSFHLNLKTPEEKSFNKTYNVNIRIKSFQQDSSTASGRTSNVKDKVNKFESLINMSPLQKSHDGPSKGHISWNITANSTKLMEDANDLSRTQPITDSVCLEDFYIDDDFPNDCNFGDNFKLSRNLADEEIMF